MIMNIENMTSTHMWMNEQKKGTMGSLETQLNFKRTSWHSQSYNEVKTR